MGTMSVVAVHGTMVDDTRGGPDDDDEHIMPIYTSLFVMMEIERFENTVNIVFIIFRR